jgi:alpha-D-xyloside xylohydrolase
MRLHGFREPGMPLGPAMTGGPNEVWSYGEEAGAILERYLRLRERIKPYVLRVMREAHEQGLPVMRPLFLEFPGDERAWSVDDAYLFGPDVLVAPVLEAGATTWTTYLPAGARWTDAWTGESYDGGSSVTVDAPLDRIPLFLRDGASLPITE